MDQKDKFKQIEENTEYTVYAAPFIGRLHQINVLKADLNKKIKAIEIFRKDEAIKMNTRNGLIKLFRKILFGLGLITLFFAFVQIFQEGKVFLYFFIAILFIVGSFLLKRLVIEENKYSYHYNKAMTLKEKYLAEEEKLKRMKKKG